MILGYFDSEGTPYIQAYVTVGRLGVDGYVEFLVDTGADSGALHPADGKFLGCRFDLLGVSHSVGGVGGSQAYYPEEASITFEGDDGSYEFVVTLDIAKPDPAIDDLPSLLGRDIINDMKMEYDYGEDVLRFHPPA